MSDDMFPVTKLEMLSEVEREIAMRRMVYPKLIATKAMSQRAADRKLALMVAVANFLRAAGAPR